MSSKWFDRKFDFSFDTDKYSLVYDRLKQAPDTLRQLIINVTEDKLTDKPDGKWSIKEHTGHLSVLEPVWRIRIHDILESKPVLTPADLTNQATTEAGFNNNTLLSLLDRFTAEREATFSLLNDIDVMDGSKTSLHPRLQQPMRIIDILYFVAEHDDHHISVIREMVSMQAI